MKLKVKVYPIHGWSSYGILVEVPDWVKNINEFLKEWVKDNLNNVDRWEIKET